MWAQMGSPEKGSQNMPILQKPLLGQREGEKMRTVHGYSGTPFYQVWQNIKKRCFDPKCHSFRDYGARGINVCNEWLSFINFKIDMYDSYIKHKNGHNSTTIERTNNDEGYSPENCCWITLEEQSLNRRPSRCLRSFIAVSSQNKRFASNNQSSFARTHNLKPKKINDVLRGRRKLHSGWSFNYI